LKEKFLSLHRAVAGYKTVFAELLLDFASWLENKKHAKLVHVQVLTQCWCPGGLDAG